MSNPPSILPSNHKEFNTKEYWDRFFTERKAAFEWYGNLRDLKNNISHKFPRKSSRILMIGCGNSDFSSNLYDEGYQNIVNLDFSDIVIEEMKKKNENRTNMSWIVGDMTNLEAFASESFDVVLDKGALDALMSENTKENKAAAIRMYKEIDRVLSFNGQYVCITLAEEYILKSLGSFFISKSFCSSSATPSNYYLDIMRVTPFVDPLAPNTSNTSPFLTFFFSFVKNTEKVPKIYSYLNNNLKNVNKYFEVLPNQFHDFVSSLQHFFQLSNRLSTVELGRFESIPIFASDPNISGKKNSGNENHPEVPRFTFYIMDALLPEETKLVCAVLLIPSGSEASTSFTSKNGLIELAAQASCQRIIAVSCNRPHIFPSSKDQLQQELNPLVQFCMPKEVNLKKDSVPYMAIAAQYDWKVVETKKSPVSGDFVVEELDDEDDFDSIYRRLVFLKSQDLIQTEVKLIKKKKKVASKSNGGKNKNKKNQNKSVKEDDEENYVLDFSYIDDHHRAMLSAITLMPHLLPFNSSNSNPSCLVIGLGGGALPMCLRKLHSKMSILSCELDKAVSESAKDFFGYDETGEMGVIVEDGLVLIDNLYNKIDSPDVESLSMNDINEKIDQSFYNKFYNKLSPTSLLDLIIFDVDSAYLSYGISAPPKEFITMEKLEQVYELLAPGGGFFINVVCRGPSKLYADLIQRISMIFQVNSTGKNKGALFKIKPSSSHINIILVAIKGGKNVESEADETLKLAIASNKNTSGTPVDSSNPFLTRSTLQISMASQVKNWMKHLNSTDIFKLEELLDYLHPV